MSSALLTAVSGLQAAQQYLDVTGNNLANVDTTGYKSQGVDFQDLIYETLNDATTTSTNVISGTNATQIGLGVKLGATPTNFSQGTLQETGRNLDLALQGQGFFVVNNGASNLYTRAGSFDVDTQGYLVDPSTGYRVQRFGTVGEATATTPAFQTPGNDDVKIPYGTAIAGQATENVTLQGNLSTSLAVGATFSTAIQVFDTQGTGHSLTLTFTKTAANTFSLAGSVSDGGTVTGLPVNNVTFNADGSLGGPATVTIGITYPSLPANQAVNLNLGTVGGFNGLTQSGGTSSAAAVSQDGSTAGSLTNVSIGQDGTIQGTFSNGRSLAIAQLSIATFTNQGGLERQGDNYYGSTVNSGPALLGTAEAGGRASIQSGALEQSNVDVSLEFTNLIVAQRAYQVNARTITTEDQLLASLVAIQ
jgi:flagellar hook protein FlgE